MSLKFRGSCTANLLWFNKGFQLPDGDVEVLGNALTEHFGKYKIVEKINEVLEENMIKSNEKPTLFRLDSSIGYHYLNILKMKDVNFDGNIIKDLVLRIHLCNDKANMKAKIVAIFDMLFKCGLSTKDIINYEIKIIELQKELCHIIFNSLSVDEFPLGGKNYECSIYSIGFSDDNISTLIEANNLNIDGNSSQEVIDVYRVLLLDGVYISAEKLPNDPESILGLFKKGKMERANIILYDPDGKIPIENVNYEIGDREEDKSYIIANLVKKDAEKTTTNNFLTDLLEST